MNEPKANNAANKAFMEYYKHSPAVKFGTREAKARTKAKMKWLLAEQKLRPTV